MAQRPHEAVATESRTAFLRVRHVPTQQVVDEPAVPSEHRPGRLCAGPDVRSCPEAVGLNRLHPLPGEPGPCGRTPPDRATAGRTPSGLCRYRLEGVVHDPLLAIVPAIRSSVLLSPARRQHRLRGRRRGRRLFSSDSVWLTCIRPFGDCGGRDGRTSMAEERYYDSWQASDQREADRERYLDSWQPRGPRGRGRGTLFRLVASPACHESKYRSHRPCREHAAMPRVEIRFLPAAARARVDATSRDTVPLGPRIGRSGRAPIPQYPWARELVLVPDTAPVTYIVGACIADVWAGRGPAAYR